MSVAGKWSITVQSPMGAQKSTVEMKTEGSVLTGSAVSPQGTQPLANGKVDGNNVSWEVSITSPMQMTLGFAGKVEGNKIAGKVKAGSFGSFDFSGERA